MLIVGIVLIGHYCVNGSKTSTPTDEVTGDSCKLGQYCPEGSSEGIGCPAGKPHHMLSIQCQSICKCYMLYNETVMGNGMSASSSEYGSHYQPVMISSTLPSHDWNVNKPQQWVLHPLLLSKCDVGSLSSPTITELEKEFQTRPTV